MHSAKIERNISEVKAQRLMFTSGHEVHQGRMDGPTDGCCRSIKDQRGRIYREKGRRKMSHRAGLEMLCTSGLQAEELIAERTDGGSSARAQSRTEEADGLGRGREENTKESWERRKVSYR